MDNPSILLLAVQRAILAPSSSSKKVFIDNFLGVTQFDQDVIPKSNMYDYLSFVIEQMTESINPSIFDIDIKEIKISLGMDQMFESWQLGNCTALTSNTFYDHSIATASMFTYFFSPREKNDPNFIVCEYVMLNVKLHLNDDIVILHHENKTLFGGRIEWDEEVRIPTTISTQTVVDAFAAILRPLINGDIKEMPSHFIPQLVETAKQINEQSNQKASVFNSKGFFAMGNIIKQKLFKSLYGISRSDLGSSDIIVDKFGKNVRKRKSTSRMPRLFSRSVDKDLSLLLPHEWIRFSARRGEFNSNMLSSANNWEIILM